MANAETYAVGVLELACKIAGKERVDLPFKINIPLNELGIDSLDLIDLVMECEERWGVEIKEDDLPVPTTALHLGAAIAARPRRED